MLTTAEAAAMAECHWLEMAKGVTTALRQHQGGGPMRAPDPVEGVHLLQQPLPLLRGRRP